MSSNVPQKIIEAAKGHHPGSSGFIRFNCPMCLARTGVADTRRSIGWNPELGVVKCFRCSYSLCSGKRRGTEKKQLEFRYADDIRSALTEDTIYSRRCIRYLTGRGLSEAEIQMADPHYSLAREYGRVILPHKHRDGQWWGYSARSMVDESILPWKVTTPANIPKNFLYNEEALFDQTESPVIIVEGVIDALKLLPDAVSLLGKNVDLLMDKVIDGLMRGHVFRPIVLALDGDAWPRGLATQRRLRLRGVQSVYVGLPPGTDPGSLPADFVIRQLEEQGQL